MQNPLFVTLTIKNVAKICSSDIRNLRRNFSKLRHQKLWYKRVLGGVAAVEVTNTGEGWHPHLHAVIDCQWLAWKTPMPYRSMARDQKKELYKEAAIEMHDAWARLVKQDIVSIRIKRANRATIAKEVLKYTVKNEDLVLAQGNAGDMIRAMDSCRLMTTFGTAHGKTVRDIRAEAKLQAEEFRKQANSLNENDSCCPAPMLMPDRDCLGSPQSLPGNDRVYYKKISKLTCVGLALATL